jgi:hypothetical protein
MSHTGRITSLILEIPSLATRVARLTTNSASLTRRLPARTDLAPEPRRSFFAAQDRAPPLTLEKPKQGLVEGGDGNAMVQAQGEPASVTK